MLLRLRKQIPFFLILITLGLPGGVVSSCAPKACPANDKVQFNRKRARYAMINHMKRRGGHGQRKHQSKIRRPKYKFFETRLKKKQFKHQTK
ncbi:MAG: hypothetical protein HYZ16_08180 [Bacteroidetes bacterium]|jgi:hypothetical protein|nr:hypothetical protein [Bacteroidota bacterium]